jgi:hypothetical protein
MPGYGGRQYSNPANNSQFEFPSLRSEYENTVSHPNAQVSSFSLLDILH